MKNSHIIRRVLISSILFLALLGILVTNPRIAMEEGTTDTMLAMQMEPVNAKTITPFLFGHEAFYADLFWIHCIRWSVEKGIPNMFEYLNNMLNLITDLDPRFEQVYIWAGLSLNYATSNTATYEQKIVATNDILLKGWNYIQQDTETWNHFSRFWMIPQILGYNYGIELKDHAKALEYTRALIAVPNLPPHLKTWATTLLREQSQAETGKDYMENLLAIETLQAQMNMTDDDVVKDKLKGKLLVFYKKLYSDKYAEQRMKDIQQEVRDLIETWKTDYAFLPFPLYTLLHSRKSSEENKQGLQMYQIFFPNLGGK